MSVERSKGIRRKFYGSVTTCLVSRLTSEKNGEIDHGPKQIKTVTNSVFIQLTGCSVVSPVFCLYPPTVVVRITVPYPDLPK